MPQNELNSDVAHFTTHESNLYCTISGCCNCKYFSKKLRKKFYWPKANFFCIKWRNSRMAWLLPNFYPVGSHAPCNNLTCGKTGLKNWMVKRNKQQSFSAICKTSCMFLLSVLPQLKLYQNNTLEKRLTGRRLPAFRKWESWRMWFSKFSLSVRGIL